jgi:hypothetical protein
MADLLPALVHLPPPNGSSTVRFDRFAPYWKWPERYGLSKLRHHWAYDFVLAGLPERERTRIAYFFDYDDVEGNFCPEYARPVAERTSQWREAARARTRLELRRSATGTTVFDSRACRVEEEFPLTREGMALLRALDGLRSRASLHEALAEQGVALGEAELSARLEDFVARRFVIEENGCWLSLVLDPQERRRVAERRVALRLERHGLRWPQDFPDPEKREIVRAAMLSLGREARQ